MDYKDYVGKTFRFNKGEPVPQWLYRNQTCFFGTDVLIKTEKHRVHFKCYIPEPPYYLFGKHPDFYEREFLIEVRGTGSITQVCPTISFDTNYKGVVKAGVK